MTTLVCVNQTKEYISFSSDQRYYFYTIVQYLNKYFFHSYFLIM